MLPVSLYTSMSLLKNFPTIDAKILDTVSIHTISNLASLANTIIFPLYVKIEEDICSR